MRKSGKNINGYLGDRIDAEEVSREVQRLAVESGWRVQWLRAGDDLELLTLHRQPAHPRRRVYVSAGIHGDEPAGPLAVRELLRQDAWPADHAFHLCPCLNPAGFRSNRRENEAGVDLNRDYGHLRTPAVRAHTDWLLSLPPLDLSLCLHEDWESNGFYLYELDRDNAPSRAEEIIRRVSSICPVDLSPTIEGRAAEGGIVRATIDALSRPEWPEAFFLVEHKTRLNYTFESPSDYALTTRVAALCAAVGAALA